MAYSFLRVRPCRLAAHLLVGVFLCFPFSSVSLASERIVSHPAHQLALFGYDPVAYFADGQARLGSRAYETLYQRLVWRFANEGNYRSFLADPDRFIPAYGGHGAFSLSYGAVSIGHPEIWIGLGGRIFFFRDIAARYAFLLEAENLVSEADRHWDGVVETLSP